MKNHRIAVNEKLKLNIPVNNQENQKRKNALQNDGYNNIIVKEKKNVFLFFKISLQQHRCFVKHFL